MQLLLFNGTASTVTLETGAIKLTAGNPELGKY
jgi:hypothetical protein